VIVRLCVWEGTEAARKLALPETPVRRLGRVYGRDRRLRSVWETLPFAPFRIAMKDGRVFEQR